MTAEQVNPALTVEARFVCPVEDDARTSRFVLSQNPEIAAWLLTILDYILSRLGKLAGERPIAGPPGGETLQRLIAGAVILPGQRPDGGLALRLNPGVEVRLWFSARRPGQPAHTASINMAEEPDLARWLLTRWLPGEQSAPSPALADDLRRHALLMTDLPPPAACFPDPARRGDPATELASATSVVLQPAGQPVPAEIRELLGRHTPALPEGAGIAWGVDAGTGLAFPSLLETPTMAPARGSAAAHRAASWDRQREDARRDLREHRYAVLREILPPVPRAALRTYVRQLVQAGYFPVLGDGQVELRSAIHNEPTIASLHRGLAAILGSIGATTQASYCYLSCYEAGAVLPPHKDRPQCLYNLSLVLDMQEVDSGREPEPWPIYLEVDGQPRAVHLQVGDGLVYSGTEVLHWRDALPPGQRAIVCFFHFVPTDFAGSLD